jgi:hypothetical protein
MLPEFEREWQGFRCNLTVDGANTHGSFAAGITQYLGYMEYTDSRT